MTCVFIFNLHIPQKIDLCVTTHCHQWELRELKRSVRNLEADRNNSQVKFVPVLMLAAILLLMPQVTSLSFMHTKADAFIIQRLYSLNRKTAEIFGFFFSPPQSNAKHVHAHPYVHRMLSFWCGLSVSAASATTAQQLLLDFSAICCVKWEYGELWSLNNLIKSAVHTAYS